MVQTYRKFELRHVARGVWYIFVNNRYQISTTSLARARTLVNRFLA